MQENTQNAFILKINPMNILLILFLLLEASCFNSTPPPQFDRTEIKARLQEKIENNEPLVAHILVPLCDNEHQGIVPVSASLGDGTNLRSNLYWGARYGMKSHFKLDNNWHLLSTEKDISESILERIIFKRNYPNGAIVYLVADAYRGDQMEACLTDFLFSLGGWKENYLQINNQKIGLHHAADLIGFNGHNGLMDMNISSKRAIHDQPKDAVVIACASHDYFVPHLQETQAYPLLLTTNLLAPEAYVMEGIIDAWANLEDGASIHKSAGQAYHTYQKCGIKGATRLFKTGW